MTHKHKQRLQIKQNNEGNTVHSNARDIFNSLNMYICYSLLFWYQYFDQFMLNDQNNVIDNIMEKQR